MSACLIPEILFQIAPLLDTHAHLSCLQVCRLWHTVFTPYFWSNINDYNWPWCNLLKPLDNSKRSNSTPLRGALNPKARLFQDRLSKYHDHVRHLTINYDSLLLIAFEAQLTQLISLHIRAHFVSTHRYSRIRYDSTLPSDPTALRLSRQVDDSRVPESIFFQVPEVTYHLSIPHAMEFTRKCWHLILDNTTTLQSLRIMKNSRQTLLRLAPPSRARDFPYLRADSIGFLKGTLEKMSRLNELEVGSQAEEFVLQSIGRELEGKKFLPLVTGLHYSARPGNALLTLLHPPADLDTNGNVNVNNNTHSTEQDERQISVNTTVKVLTLHSTVSIACLRDLLVIFPRLQELSGAAHDFLTDASHHGAQVGEFDRIIVSNIKYMTGLCHEFHLFRFNIRLPCLRSIGPQLYFRNVQDMMQVLQLCPELEILEVKELRGMDDHMAVMYVNLHTQRDLEMSGGGGSHIVDGDDDNGDGEGDVDGSGITRRRAGMDWRIQTLTIQHSQYRGHTIQQLLRRMPNLVHLELGSISAKAVEVIGETCYGSLEDVRFYLRSPCFREMSLLLVKCSRLRSVRGLGLAVRAGDMGVMGNEWSCLGTRELQIEIHGVPRLTARQEEVLFDERRTSNNDNDNNSMSSEDKKEYEEALAQYQANEAVRYRVLDQLSRLRELRLLDLSFQPLTYKHYQTRFCYGSSQQRRHRIPICDNPVPNSLSLSLSRLPLGPVDVANKFSSQATTSKTIVGLEQLKTLKNLKAIGFKALAHGIDEAEVRWMRKQWPSLKTVLGLSGVLYKGHGTGDSRCGCLGQDMLPVRMRRLFEMWVQGVVMPLEEA